MTSVPGGTGANGRNGDDALDRFSPATRAWFRAAFPDGATPAQAQAWATIEKGDNTLVIAPTGSGKTLAAFLWALDGLAAAPVPEERARRCRVLYVSPLKALAADIERNLRAPLAGIRRAAGELAGDSDAVPEVSVGMRTGDTPASERRALVASPPDILITTPESLFLLLTSRAREALAGVRTVIVDEVHALAGTKRGAHLALTLERLDARLERPAQRIGLSATVRPPDRVATFLGGQHPATVVAPPNTPNLDLRIAVPVQDMTELEASVSSSRTDDTASKARTSVWPHVEERVLDLVERHRSSIVFTNSRRIAERLCARLNELANERAGGPLPPDSVPAEIMAEAGIGRATDRVVARAHHGSVSKSERATVEADLKAGRLPCVVATSSLELGIDMGAVDLVVQVESPPSVANGLQRVGRAGHHVGEVSRGVLFPKFRGDLLATAVVAERMRAGLIEELHGPENPLDVLAQQVVAMVAMDDWPVADLAAVVRRAAPFATLPDSALSGVLDMLSGRYPSDEFAELRPRLVWDRDADPGVDGHGPDAGADTSGQDTGTGDGVGDGADDAGTDAPRSRPRTTGEARDDRPEGDAATRQGAGGVVRGRPGAQRLAVVSGGTIPDRGTYTVHLSGAGTGGDGQRGAPTRVGELDEEMVYESRVGDVFVLGASAWRIESITADRVLVSPAPGRPGRLPFWKADAMGRPPELGRAIGALTREIGGLDNEAALERARAAGLDDWAAENLVGFLAEQREVTGHVPDDRTVVVERFRDELGDWRVVVHSPLGARVHAPWALALGGRLRERYGLDAQVVHGDDGIVLRLPDVDDNAGGGAGSAGPRRGGAGLSGLLSLRPEEVEEAVTAELGGSALFAARFRECAARALLLPRRRPERRMPLWQQRQRSAQLLSVAGQYGSFPIVLETVRECLRDVFDIGGLAELMSDIAARRVRVVEVETPRASPFAQSLLMGYTAAYLYEGDAPLAELKAQALTLDSALLADLLGQADLRELLDPDVLAETEAWLRRLAPERAVRPEHGVEETADLLRELGPLGTEEARQRGVLPEWLAELEEARRAILVRVGGVRRWAAVEDAARLRDGLGVELPAWLAEGGGTRGTDGGGDEDTEAAFAGTAEAFTAPVADPLGDLVSRFARTNGPFTAGDVVHRLGADRNAVLEVLHRLTRAGRLVEGEFRPRGAAPSGSAAAGEAPSEAHPSEGATEWCDADVLRRLRRRSITRLRREVEPVPPRVLARFVPAWQYVAPLDTDHALPRPGTAPPAPVGTPERRAGHTVAHASDAQQGHTGAGTEAGPDVPATRTRPADDGGTTAADPYERGSSSPNGADTGTDASVAATDLPHPDSGGTAARHDASEERNGPDTGEVEEAVPATALRRPDGGDDTARPDGAAEEPFERGVSQRPGGTGAAAVGRSAPGRRRLRGPDAVFTAVESLRGAPVPASALESLVLPARVEGYVPALLDELTTAGEVLWAGVGRAGTPAGNDGWVCLVPADEAELLLPERAPVEGSWPHDAVLAALDGGGALFFRDIADRVTRVEGAAAVSDADLVTALWDLTWAGWIGNDTLAPLRALLGSGATPRRSRRSRRPVMPTRTGPPTVAGRWWVLPERDSDPTRRGLATASALLDRYGVLTRGPVVAEQERRRAPGGAAGGFSAVYPVLRGFEEAGKARRGYFVDGLGAAQFAPPGAVDRLRSFADPADGPGGPGEAGVEPPLVLAAADPANVYGAALPWPDVPDAGARPGRKVGALVVLDDGVPTLYLERGGRTVLTFGSSPTALTRAASALANVVRAGHVSTLTIERADGREVFGTPLEEALTTAGFHPTPKGLRIRG